MTSLVDITGYGSKRFLSRGSTVNLNVKNALEYVQNSSNVMVFI